MRPAGGDRHPDGAELMSQDPPRDPELALRLRHYEADAAFELDAVFRDRLAEVTTAALRRRQDERWIVAAGRFGRFAIPFGVLAAAASVILLVRSTPVAPSATGDVMLTAALGAASATDIAGLGPTAGLPDAELLRAFGVALPR